MLLTPNTQVFPCKQKSHIECQLKAHHKIRQWVYTHQTKMHRVHTTAKIHNVCEWQKWTKEFQVWRWKMSLTYTFFWRVFYLLNICHKLDFVPIVTFHPWTPLSCKSPSDSFYRKSLISLSHSPPPSSLSGWCFSAGTLGSDCPLEPWESCSWSHFLLPACMLANGCASKPSPPCTEAWPLQLRLQPGRLQPSGSHRRWPPQTIKTQRIHTEVRWNRRGRCRPLSTPRMQLLQCTILHWGTGRGCTHPGLAGSCVQWSLLGSCRCSRWFCLCRCLH